jgi:hypothetical protein
MAQQDEGIMALMGAGQGMGATPEDPQVDMYEFRKQAYPVMKDSVREVSPEAYGEMQATLSSELAAAGDMPVEGIEQLLEIVDYINENPEEYPQVRAALISAGMIDEDDFPAEMDVEYFATMEVVLQEALAKAQGEQAEMAQGPVEMMPPQGFAKGGIAEAARMVASKGRYGDTMLAHITPEEAKLLKARGGSGTINPETGLPEFFLKKVFKAAKKVVKSVVKTVKNVVKAVVSSPIGRIVATVGLSMIGVPPPLASALVTKAAGGSWKDALKSAAVSYLAGPTSPIASTVTKMTPFLNNLSPAVQAGLRSGLTSTTASLLTGSSLKDAVTAGVTSGLMTGLQTPQEAAPVRDATVMTPDQVLGGGAPDAMTGQVSPVAGGAFGPSAPLGALSPDTAMQAVTAAPTAGQAPTAPAGADPIADMYNSYQMASTPAAAPQTAPAGAQDPSMFQQAKDFLWPSKPTDAAIAQKANEIYDSTGGRISYNDAYARATKELTPSILQQYGPAVGLGIAGLGMAGGFEQKPLPETPFQQAMRTPIDVPPSLQRPMQNLPGVEYDESGNIIGSKPWNPYASMQSMGPTEVATPGIMSLQTPPGYTPPPGAPTMGQGVVPQPYNTSAMYTNLMQPRYFNQGGVANLAQGGYPRRIGQIEGPGTETSDDIPAMLSDGEFVMTARAVRGAGNGSRREGAKKMYAMMHQLEQNAARG